MMTLSSIRGQRIIVEVLQRALTGGKLAHAYLFEGIQGCGKTTTALALVQAVFCGSGGCGSCPSCRKLESLQHPDLHQVEPDGQNIKIDQIRELQRALSYRPFEAPKKACIIHQADRMNPAAANALLKTLEEPPGEALMILVTENREALLPTVLSRCQLLQFAPLSEETVAAILIHEGMDAGRAGAAAAMAGGSLTAGRQVADEGSSAEREAILTELSTLSRRDISTLLGAAERFGSSKETALAATETLLALFRDLLQLKTGDGSTTGSGLRNILDQLAGKRTLPAILQGLEALTEIRAALLRNANPRLAMEVLFLRLADKH